MESLLARRIDISNRISDVVVNAGTIRFANSTQSYRSDENDVDGWKTLRPIRWMDGWIAKLLGLPLTT